MKKTDVIDLYFYGKFVKPQLGPNFDLSLKAFQQQLNALELKSFNGFDSLCCTKLMMLCGVNGLTHAVVGGGPLNLLLSLSTVLMLSQSASQGYCQYIEANVVLPIARIGLNLLFIHQGEMGVGACLKREAVVCP